MKRKVCVRSMVLGAVIMLVGLAVGAIVSPPLIAQRNGVFDKISCRTLEVVDENGNLAIVLSTELINRDNEPKANGVLVLDKQGNGGGIELICGAQKNWIQVSGEGAIESINLSVGEQRDASIHISDGLGKVAWEAPLHLQEDFK